MSTRQVDRYAFNKHVHSAGTSSRKVTRRSFARKGSGERFAGFSWRRPCGIVPDRRKWLGLCSSFKKQLPAALDIDRGIVYREGIMHTLAPISAAAQTSLRSVTVATAALGALYAYAFIYFGYAYFYFYAFPSAGGL